MRKILNNSEYLQTYQIIHGTILNVYYTIMVTTTLQFQTQNTFNLEVCSFLRQKSLLWLMFAKTNSIWLFDRTTATPTALKRDWRLSKNLIRYLSSYEYIVDETLIQNFSLNKLHYITNNELMNGKKFFHILANQIQITHYPPYDSKI